MVLLRHPVCCFLVFAGSASASSSASASASASFSLPAALSQYHAFNGSCIQARMATYERAPYINAEVGQPCGQTLHIAHCGWLWLWSVPSGWACFPSLRFLCRHRQASVVKLILVLSVLVLPGSLAVSQGGSFGDALLTASTQLAVSPIVQLTLLDANNQPIPVNYLSRSVRCPFIPHCRSSCSPASTRAAACLS